MLQLYMLISTPPARRSIHGAMGPGICDSFSASDGPVSAKGPGDGLSAHQPGAAWSALCLDHCLV